MDIERRGYKVCGDVAETIRQLVRDSLETSPKVPDKIATELRRLAKYDAQWHKLYDQEPPVERSVKDSS